MLFRVILSYSIVRFKLVSGPGLGLGSIGLSVEPEDGELELFGEQATNKVRLKIRLIIRLILGVKK